MASETGADAPMCPLLTCAAGKSRPCAKERCEWWVESFDARFSACAVLALASSSGKALGLAKRVVRGIAQGGGF